MLNLIDLEARWLRYKVRTFLPYVALFIVLLGVLFGLFYYLGTLTQTQNRVLEAAQPKSEDEDALEKKAQMQVQTQLPSSKNDDATLEVQETQVAQEVPTLTQEQEQVEPKPQIKEQIVTAPITPQEHTTRVLKPSMEFMKHIHTQNTSSSNTVESYKNGSFQSDTQSVNVEPAQNYEEEVVSFESEPDYYEEESSKKIDITRKDSQEDIEAVIRRFNKNNNPALSLFVAKKYYEMGDYHNAYNYALITNNINSQIESSWLIFAKSLVKMGKKELAARTLQEYIQNSHSKSASRLLDDILNGKFK